MISDTQDPAVFWQEYEQEYGEKVLAHGLGCYMSGWDGIKGKLWGLLIATEGGFRFHHFSQENWFLALSRVSGGASKGSREQTMFIPKDRIDSAELHMEESWIRKFLFPNPPRLIIRYRNEDGSERLFYAETEKKSLCVVEALQSLIA